MANSADPDQLASSEANWSRSTLFGKVRVHVYPRSAWLGLKGKSQPQQTTFWFFIYLFFFYFSLCIKNKEKLRILSASKFAWHFKGYVLTTLVLNCEQVFNTGADVS